MNRAERQRRAAIWALSYFKAPPAPPKISGVDAALCLDALAAGKTPERARIIAGALALDTLVTWCGAERDIRDAAAGLSILACGGSLDLDAAGQVRASRLADAVRSVAGCREELPSTSRASHYS
jgi:hypothetical protein